MTPTCFLYVIPATANGWLQFHNIAVFPCGQSSVLYSGTRNKLNERRRFGWVRAVFIEQKAVSQDACPYCQEWPLPRITSPLAG